MQKKISGGLLDLMTFGGALSGKSPDPSDDRYRKSPDPKTGGAFPVPSFDEDGGYLEPTPVPLPGGYLAPRPPQNQLMPNKPIRPPRNQLMPNKPIDPARLMELINLFKDAKEKDPNFKL
jgi:hypothetical protein